MSVDAPTAGVDPLPEADTEVRSGPKPAAHGASVQAVFNDVDLDVGLDVPGVATDRETTVYDAVLAFWREHVGDRDREPFVVGELDADRLDWLPTAREDRDHVLVMTSSRWMAGRGEGDDYRAYYKYDVKLREVDDDGELRKPPLSLHLQIVPQEAGLVYPDGNPLELPFGEGTRVTCQTTWAESAAEIEGRMLDGLAAVVGADRDALELARHEDSRKIAKAEAHVRFAIAKKGAVVETVEQTKDLIAYGGRSEVDAHQQRIREGWLEAVVDADRWQLLGFPETDYNIELKVYQAANWPDIPASEPGHHPKLEASFAGVQGRGALPHVDEWDDTMQILREVVSTHLDWAGVGREDLVADDFFDGPAVDAYDYEFPTNRREQLYERYRNVATEIYREATKAHTQAVYDILRVVATEQGATYDVLERQTGLARSTIRHHVRRLTEARVVDRIGNPRLVVYPGWEALENAREILREVYPDDDLDAANDRAARRRERREQRDDPPVADADQDDRDDAGDQDVDADDPVGGDRDPTGDADQDDVGDASSSRNVWRYFGELDLQPHQLSNALERGYLDDDEVRVRVDRRDWIG